MEAQDVSADWQLLRKIQERLSTIRARPQLPETPSTRRPRLEKDWPPQPFLYQG
jgi:hypothetical protein